MQIRAGWETGATKEWRWVKAKGVLLHIDAALTKGLRYSLRGTLGSRLSLQAFLGARLRLLSLLKGTPGAPGPCSSALLCVPFPCTGLPLQGPQRTGDSTRVKAWGGNTEGQSCSNFQPPSLSTPLFICKESTHQKGGVLSLACPFWLPLRRSAMYPLHHFSQIDEPSLCHSERPCGR